MEMGAYFTINWPTFAISIWFLVEILQLKRRTKDERDARDAFLESVKPCIQEFKKHFAGKNYISEENWEVR